MFLKEFFPSKTFLNLFSKVNNITLDPDWANILDPNSNSMYLDQQHCYQISIFYLLINFKKVSLINVFYFRINT